MDAKLCWCDETVTAAAAVAVVQPRLENFVMAPPPPESGAQNSPEEAGSAFTDFSSVYSALFSAEESEAPANVYTEISRAKKKYTEAVNATSHSHLSDSQKDTPHAYPRHDPANATSEWDETQILCSFHVKNQCRYGEYCRYKSRNFNPAQHYVLRNSGEVSEKKIFTFEADMYMVIHALLAERTFFIQLCKKMLQSTCDNVHPRWSWSLK